MYLKALNSLSYTVKLAKWGDCEETEEGKKINLYFSDFFNPVCWVFFCSSVLNTSSYLLQSPLNCHLQAMQ